MNKEVYKSDCGYYLCRVTDDWGRFEVWATDGSLHWRNDNRIRTWKEAAIKRHPMAYSVGGYSAAKTGQKEGSFTLSLLHCDVTKFVEPYKGNTIIETLDIVFRRKVPAQNVPHWIREVGK